MTRSAEFLKLTPAQCRAVLARNWVGRLAFVHDGRVVIEPIGYVLDGNWLFARSAWGTKIAALSKRPFAAFEVDEPTSPYDWRSVVVTGTVYPLPADGSMFELKQRRRAVRVLRGLIPGALTRRDPLPDRDLVYGLHIDRLEGRAARPTKRTPARRARRTPSRRVRVTDGS